MQTFIDYTKRMLMRNVEGSLDYLTDSRKLSKEIIEEFDLGYCPKSYPYSVRFSIKGRVIFPTHDPYGKLVGFTGRAIDYPNTQPKYSNSRYPRDMYWYNLHRAAPAILEAGYAILVEGQMDAIALYSAGKKNVLPTQGNGISEHKISVLLRYTNKVVDIPDGDAAGAKILKQVTSHLTYFGVSVKLLAVPGGKDIDEFIREGEYRAFVDSIAFDTPGTDTSVSDLKRRISAL